MSRVPPILPAPAAVSSPRLPPGNGSFANPSPTASPRHSLALPGHMSPYRDSAARFSINSLGSPRSSGLARDAAIHYPTSASRPSSPTGNRGRSTGDDEEGDDEDKEGDDDEDEDSGNAASDAEDARSANGSQRGKADLYGASSSSSRRPKREHLDAARSSRPSSPMGEQEIDAARGEYRRLSTSLRGCGGGDAPTVAAATAVVLAQYQHQV